MDSSAGERRPISAFEGEGVWVQAPRGEVPSFQWVDPRTLLVDEGYQRELSARSRRLIRRIIEGWDWRRFKPPVVAETEDGLEVIDGQHTAIAAATHPDIEQIPVMRVVAHERAARASAFIGHNRDRIAVTKMQVHHASVAAMDEDALTLDQVCRRAGVTVLRHPPAGGEFQPGETVAIGAIAALIKRRGVKPAREILQALREADCAPISAAEIKASELLLFGEPYAGKIELGEIAMTLMALADIADREARAFAASHRVPYWRALAAVIFQRRRRTGAGAARGDGGD